MFGLELKLNNYLISIQNGFNSILNLFDVFFKVLITSERLIFTHFY